MIEEKLRGKIAVNNSPGARARFERMREALTVDRGASNSYDRCTSSDVTSKSFIYNFTLADLGLPIKPSESNSHPYK